jgi:hypothetical protein
VVVVVASNNLLRQLVIGRRRLRRRQRLSTFRRPTPFTLFHRWRRRPRRRRGARLFLVRLQLKNDVSER